MDEDLEIAFIDIISRVPTKLTMAPMANVRIFRYGTSPRIQLSPLPRRRELQNTAIYRGRKGHFESSIMQGFPNHQEPSGRPRTSRVSEPPISCFTCEYANGSADFVIYIAPTAARIRSLGSFSEM